MRITDYSKEEIIKMAKAGLIDYRAVRDYDAFKAIESGEKIKNVAMDASMDRTTLWRRRKKFGYL
jgi:transcriptional regulator of acetoin/glycerol metabolism